MATSTTPATMTVRWDDQAVPDLRRWLRVPPHRPRDPDDPRVPITGVDRVIITLDDREGQVIPECIALAELGWERAVRTYWRPPYEDMTPVITAWLDQRDENADKDQDQDHGLAPRVTRIIGLARTLHLDAHLEAERIPVYDLSRRAEVVAEAAGAGAQGLRWVDVSRWRRVAEAWLDRGARLAVPISGMKGARVSWDGAGSTVRRLDRRHSAVERGRGLMLTAPERTYPGGVVDVWGDVYRIEEPEIQWDLGLSRASDLAWAARERVLQACRVWTQDVDGGHASEVQRLVAAYGGGIVWAGWGGTVGGSEIKAVTECDPMVIAVVAEAGGRVMAASQDAGARDAAREVLARYDQILTRDVTWEPVAQGIGQSRRWHVYPDQ